MCLQRTRRKRRRPRRRRRRCRRLSSTGSFDSPTLTAVATTMHAHARGSWTGEEVLSTVHCGIDLDSIRSFDQGRKQTPCAPMTPLGDLLSPLPWRGRKSRHAHLLGTLCCGADCFFIISRYTGEVKCMLANGTVENERSCQRKVLGKLSRDPKRAAPAIEGREQSDGGTDLFSCVLLNVKYEHLRPFGIDTLPFGRPHPIAHP